MTVLLRVRSVCRKALLAALAMGLAAPTSMVTHADTYTRQFSLEGPFPIRQEARLRVDELLISISDFYSAGEARFRFRFDTGTCNWQYPLDEVSIFPPNAPLADCPYEHVEVRELTGLTGNIFGVPHEVNVVLPESAPATISRYDGAILRARVFARELDLFEDDQLGGAIGAFSHHSNFGAGGDPSGPAQDAHAFGLNERAVQIAANGFYAGEFKISLSPAESAPNKRLVPWQVWGEDDRCNAGQPFTFGVKMRNPEAVTTEPYAVAIARLDPETNTFADMWTSAVLPGMAGPDYQGEPTPVTVTLGRGVHRLAVFAPGHANAMELEIRCEFFNIDLPTIAPGVGAEPEKERSQPGLLPTPTRTPVPDRGIEVGPRLTQPTPTSTPGQLTVPGRSR